MCSMSAADVAGRGVRGCGRVWKGEKGKETGDKIKPQRNGDITKLYTGGLDTPPDSKFKGKPRDELTNPIKVSWLRAITLLWPYLVMDACLPTTTS